MWTRPLASLERNRAKYGKRFTQKFPFIPPFVIHSDPEHVKEIYTAPPDVLCPGAGARVLEPVVGKRSVILLDGAPHMEQRKLMLPAFHGERMERLEDLVGRVTEEAVAEWAGEPDAPLHPRLQDLTLEIILRAVFGLDPGPRLDAMRTSVSALLVFGDSPLTLIQRPADNEARADRVERMLSRAGPLKGFIDVRERSDALIAEQIEERRRDPGDRDDVLAMLLEARHEDGSPMTFEELRDELMTLLVAGHETTASTLAWAFERIAREPRVLGTLAEEVAGGEDGDYVLATIRETLRRRPVLPNTAPRLVKKPVTIGGWDYEPGTCSVVANAYLVHHDPDIYPEPYAFRPERFLDEKPGTYTWIPFGGGRRRCLGMSFAMLEMRIVIREVMRAYELRAIGDGHERPRRRNITVTPGRGSQVGLVRRESRVPAVA
jgi:cytochrome P450